MKTKIILFVLGIIFLSGCTENTNPTAPTTIKRSSTTSSIIINSTTLETTTTTPIPIREDIEISEDLIDGFKNREFKSDAIIFLRDNSGLNYSSSRNDEELFQIYDNKKTINGLIQKDILEKIESKGFIKRIVSKDGSWFSGKLTFDSYDILRREVNILSIFSEEQGYKKVWETPYSINNSYIKTCSADSDCILVKNDCCANAALSINKKYSDFYEDIMLRNCFFRSCAANTKVWNYVSKCADGVCEVKENV